MCGFCSPMFRWPMTIPPAARPAVRHSLWRVGIARNSRQIRSILEEPVLRSRQAEMIAQGGAFVIAAEQAAYLQFRDDARDKVVEPTRQIREHDGEAVAGFGFEPFLHFVGNGLRRTDHG